jgi:hypothetical protein
VLALHHPRDKQVKRAALATRPPVRSARAHASTSPAPSATRWATLSFFTAFTIVLTYLAEVLRSSRRPPPSSDFEEAATASVRGADVDSGPGAAGGKARRRGCPPVLVFALLNFWAYVAEIVVLTLTALGKLSDEQLDDLYDADAYSTAVLFMFLAARITYVSASLFSSLRGCCRGYVKSESFVVGSTTDERRARWLVVRLIVSSVVVVVFFVIRSIMFLWRPVSCLVALGRPCHPSINPAEKSIGIFSNLAYTVLYPWFFYVLPELAPSCLLLVFMLPARNQRSRYDTPPALLAASSAPSVPLLQSVSRAQHAGDSFSPAGPAAMSAAGSKPVLIGADSRGGARGAAAVVAAAGLERAEQLSSSWV